MLPAAGKRMRTPSDATNQQTEAEMGTFITINVQETVWANSSVKGHFHELSKLGNSCHSARERTLALQGLLCHLRQIARHRYSTNKGQDSSVGIATGYVLDGPGIESRSPGVHPASCTMGAGSFPGVKRLGRGADHPPIPVPRSRKGRVITLPHSGPLGLLPLP
jgi:hypothetical protein